ncbi:MAG TPA: citrate synthase [Clostridia bacterium]|nr:citrate synthase [Clostridia bacterium]HQC68454.1 citrate synthase [Clostridia bacterium]
MLKTRFEDILASNDKKIEQLSEKALASDIISNELYEKYNVFRGLRDNKGVGVITGLTEISEMNGYIKNEDGIRVPIEGVMYYRGIDIFEIIAGIMKNNRFGYEECAYLLLCGSLPDRKELEEFVQLLNDFRSVPDSFVRDIILKAPSKDVMNAISRSILTLYSYDNNPDDISIKNVFRQAVQLIAVMPMLAVYSYQAYMHYILGKNLYIRQPKPELSTAENFLYMLKGTDRYTQEQAHILDICMILQAEHGGGNNSTFTTHVVTSSGTDTYSCVSASLGSLKGPRHGGANLKVVHMMDDILKHVKVLSDDNIEVYLEKILAKEAFDKSGLIYGLGHAVYSVSDPRALILRDQLEKYMSDKKRDRLYTLYDKLQYIAPKVIQKKRNVTGNIAINVDYYSGYLYRQLDIPEELYTPIFAISRILGWSAHRIEELANNGKIIRPAYIAVADRSKYVDIDER